MTSRPGPRAAPGRSLIAGQAAGPVLATPRGLSFWGGVDPATGRVIDAHHPLHGQSLAGTILAMPTSRGSCSGSGVLLELIATGRAPAALVFRETEDVLTLGALVALHLFDATLPVLRLPPAAFDALSAAPEATLGPDRMSAPGLDCDLVPVGTAGPALSADDTAILDGRDGAAAAVAMRIIRDMASIQGAARLTDITQAHIDGCIYASPANLRFAEVFAAMGARVRVPTTTNAISVDHANWRAQGVAEAFGTSAARLADAYVGMGARASFTCAPYLLDTAPGAGECVAWAESNAVVYANSVLGARTVKHPDFLDLCIALTGRAPLSGVYLDAERAPRRILEVALPEGADDAVWPLLGYLAGEAAPDRIPLLTGLGQRPDADALKALCAAFGTTSAAPMLHLDGITPDPCDPCAGADLRRIGPADFARLWQQFNQGPPQVDLVALGSPHFSLTECAALADLLEGVTCAAAVAGMVTTGHDTLRAARQAGIARRIEAAGFRIVTDLCWCSISEPVFPPGARVLMTNSAKYAHYAPGLSGRAVRFGGLADCVRAAATGRAPAAPVWCA